MTSQPTSVHSGERKGHTILCFQNMRKPQRPQQWPLPSSEWGESLEPVSTTALLRSREVSQRPQPFTVGARSPERASLPRDSLRCAHQGKDCDFGNVLDTLKLFPSVLGACSAGQRMCYIGENVSFLLPGLFSHSLNIRSFKNTFFLTALLRINFIFSPFPSFLIAR